MAKTTRVIRNFLIFLIISILSIFLISLLHEEKIDITILPLKLVVIAGFVSMTSIIFEILRIKIIAKTLKKKIKLKTCIDSIVGHEFISAITPFGGGGQPLAIYIMHKEGLSLGESVTISYIQTFYTIITLFIAGFISIPLFPSVLESKTLKIFIIGSLIAIIYFFGFSYFSMAKPRILKKIGIFLINLLHRINIIKSHRLYHIKMRMIKEIKIFNQHIKSSLRSNPVDIVTIFIATILHWVMRFISVYPILNLFSNSISLLKFIGLQFMITAVNYFSITPGSSGTTDILAAIVFGLFMEKKDIPTFVTIWRFFTFHIIVLFSGMMISRILYYFSHHKEEKS